MQYLYYFLAALEGYIIGSISFAIMLSKIFLKDDVRNSGSGNAGATNMARVYGIWSGVVVLLLDFGKASLAMFLGTLLGGEIGMALAGGFCALGHAFPVFFKFKGGKGVSVGAALALFIDWRAFLFVIAVFIIMVAITKIVSISSISAAVSLLILCIIFLCVGWISVPRMLLGVFGALLVVALHWQNIKRLVRGEEKKFTFKKKTKDKTEVN